MNQYPQYQQPAPRKTHKFRNFVLFPFLAVVAIIVIATSTSGGGSTPSSNSGAAAGPDTTAAAAPAAKPAPSDQLTVKYSVTGSGVASDITYTTDGQTSMNQESNVAVPWSKTLHLKNDVLTMFQVSAQGSSDSSKLTVKIYVNGKVVKTASSTGYGVASADASVQFDGSIH